MFWKVAFEESWIIVLRSLLVIYMEFFSCSANKYILTSLTQRYVVVKTNESFSARRLAVTDLRSEIKDSRF